MTSISEQLRYAKSHEWILAGGAGVATVGISDYAQRALGDVVFVELPQVGRAVKAGAEVAVVESVKAASDIYSPVSGEIVEVNAALLDTPELLNASPLQDGWLFRIKLSNGAELDNLLNADDYAAACG